MSLVVGMIGLTHRLVEVCIPSDQKNVGTRGGD
jgi:hypothetical protein